jgi:ABC-type glycerol-3-phosphate transport system substrate-binding protein
MFENLLVQAGGDLMAPDSQSTGFSGPRGVEALEFLSSLIHTDSVAYLSTGYEHQKEFAEGRVGLVQGSVTSLAFMESDMARRAENGLSTFRIGIAPLPAGRRRGVVISGTNVVIFKDHTPEQIDAAWAFVKWFTAPRQQARWFAATGYLPARRSSLSEPAAAGRIEEYPGLRGVLGQLDHATFEPQLKAWYDGREFLSEAVEIALYGQMTPEEALSRAAGLADEEISTSE